METRQESATDPPPPPQFLSLNPVGRKLRQSYFDFLAILSLFLFSLSLSPPPPLFHLEELTD